MARRQPLQTENPVGKRILRALGGRDLVWLSREADIPPQTLSDAVHKGPARTDTAAKIAKALGMSLDHLVNGEPPVGSVDAIFDVIGPGLNRALRAPKAIDVPIYDIEVAAGAGRSVHDETPIGHWPLPVSWIAEHVGSDPDLFIVTVVGDSQEPELSTGDQLIVDHNQRRLSPGMHVVRHDGYLQVKRVQLEGRKVMLLSANPAYATTVLDREADQDSFEVMGRVIAAIKVM